MKKQTLIMGVCAVAAATTIATSCKKQEHVNPFLQPYTTEFEIPPFDQISIDDYIPAIEAGIDEGRKNIEAITSNADTPTFENTMLALSDATPILDRVSLVLFALTESDSSPELQDVEEKAMSMITAYSDEVSMNPALFDRVKYLYDNLDSLNYATPERRAVEEQYKQFVRNGALLSDADKETLKGLNQRLSDLYSKFNKNLLAATNAFELVVDDEAELAGLPQQTIDNAAAEAKERGKEGKWVFTLHAPSRLAVLQYAQSRDLREKMWKGYTSLASEGEYSNLPVISDILQARARKANLLGYADFASYMTDNVMAKTPEAAESLLMSIWTPAVEKVKEEVADMQAVVDAEGAGFAIEPWDYYYYAEKVRQQKYALDENEIRPYFAVDSVRKGIFTMAQKLYGVTFKELPDAPKYNPEVKVYEVLDADGSHLAVFMTDYFTRASKRQGAWMSEFKGSEVRPDGTVVRPIIYNVGNFSKPTADQPSLLSLDDVETTFHEFGHGLHGMLSRTKLRSQAGTNVDRDFVELPSQIHEHWAFQPELLKEYAHHYATGEVIPEALVEKINAASKHNMGFMTTELAGAALLDLHYGHLNPDGDVDVMAFENEVAQKLGMPAQLTFRYRSPYFKHIFGSDGYASGYYTYLWAEVLDTDGFELFEQNGVFDEATAKSFRENILEPGGSEDPMTLYVRFRGQQPKVDALLRNRGLK